MTNTEKSSKTRLLVMAHPDDPELSCGGSIAKWALKDNIFILLMTSGEKGDWKRDSSIYDTGSRRENEAKRSAELLGVKKVIFLRHPDGMLKQVKTLGLEIAGIIRKLKPNIIITHDLWTRHFHPDHRVTAGAVMESIMIARDWHFSRFLTELGLTPHRPEELLLTHTDRPNLINDISETIENKIKAIKIHKIQLKHWENWESRIREYARKNAEGENFKYGESFYRMKL